ncbi:MAG: NERD domain-containing protein [Lachnospiraceae bacterium]|jgi:hypothetical protein|nr:NERD domain-containing protein [Lachnospiraceae bacterium]
MEVIIFIIVCLLIALLCRVLYMKKRIEKLESQLHDQKEEADRCIKQLINNINEDISAGELLLIKCFRDLFACSVFSNTAVYYHLKYDEKNRIKEIDFFVVSPKGLYAIESKMWKGTTYIHKDSCPDIFKTKTFKSFGIEKNGKVRVYNAKYGESANEIRLNSYRNPVEQIREYSRDMKNLLNVPMVKSIVIFHVAEEFDVQYDYKAFTIAQIDSYTSILTDACIKEFFMQQPDVFFDYNWVNDYIENNLHYKSKMCNSNYEQEPYSSLSKL